MNNRIKEIQVITQLGPRHFVKGKDFNSVIEERIGKYDTDIYLYDNGKLVNFIHHNVPIVIDYE